MFSEKEKKGERAAKCRKGAKEKRRRKDRGRTEEPIIIWVLEKQQFQLTLPRVNAVLTTTPFTYSALLKKSIICLLRKVMDGLIYGRTELLLEILRRTLKLEILKPCCSARMWKEK